MSQSPNDNNRPVAFFDFDGTLTTGDTLMPFLKFVVGTPIYYAKLAKLSPVLVAYFAKLLRNDVAKQAVLKQYLAGYQVDDLLELGERFNEEVISKMLRPEGMRLLRWHQKKGHVCVLVSASMDIYLEDWARKEKFCETFCTSLEVDFERRATGRIKGVNCHGEEKLKRILSWQGSRCPEITYAYGDSVGDIPIITFVDRGYCWKKEEKRFVSL